MSAEINNGDLSVWDMAMDVWSEVGTSSIACCVAGGAVRDIIMNRPIKDVDMVINLKQMAIDKGIGGSTETWAKLIKDMVPLSEEKSGAYTPKPKSFSVYESKDKKLQLIGCHQTPQEFVTNSFDFGLCFAMLNSSGLIKVHDWFLKDMEEKSLTLYVRPSITKQQIGHALTDHYPRLHAKFPDHTLKVVYVNGADKGIWHPYNSGI